MSKTFSLTITKVDEPVFTGEAQSVAVPGVAGDMVILAEHEPLISPLRAGTLSYVDAEGNEHSLETTGGTLEVAHNRAIILL